VHDVVLILGDVKVFEAEQFDLDKGISEEQVVLYLGVDQKLR
jgi:hypothetical protein